jgi:hypothetical protein
MMKNMFIIQSMNMEKSMSMRPGIRIIRKEKKPTKKLMKKWKQKRKNRKIKEPAQAGSFVIELA